MVRVLLLPAVFMLRLITRAITKPLWIEGFQVRVFAGNEDEVASRIAQALELIREYAPARFAHLRRDIQLVEVTPEHSGYLDLSRSIVLAWNQTQNQPALWLASIIVFHGVNARLHARRVLRWNERQMRVFRTCLEAQVGFLRRVPGGEDLVEHVTEQWDSGYWTPDALAAKRKRFFSKLGLPPWLSRFASWMQADHS